MKQAERKQAYIVGIAGESAGGKSTLADSLEKGLAGYKVKMFHLDEYFKEAEERPVIQGFLDGKMYRDDRIRLSGVGFMGIWKKRQERRAAEGREGKCTGLKGQKLAGSVWRNRYDNSKTGRIVSSRRGVYSDKKSKEWSL